jgi:hypothetical protein
MNVQYLDHAGARFFKILLFLHDVKEVSTNTSIPTTFIEVFKGHGKHIQIHS